MCHCNFYCFIPGSSNDLSDYVPMNHPSSPILPSSFVHLQGRDHRGKHGSICGLGRCDSPLEAGPRSCPIVVGPVVFCDSTEECRRI